MKKCPYCGKEYPGDVARCPFDDYLLAGPAESAQSPQAIAISASAPVLSSESEARPAAAPWTERQLLIIEVVLVCLVAFGTSVLSSLYSLQIDGSSRSGGGGAYRWASGVLRECSELGLVWYLLLRRGKSFADLGLTLKPEFKDIAKNIGLSILLLVGGSLLGMGAYAALFYSGLTTISHHEASRHVHNYLFGGGIYWSTRLFQIVNPFNEELIVRAYLMTQVKQLTNSAAKAVFISTVLQTSYHLYQGAPMALMHGATFLLWSIFYAKTNRITPIVLAHLYADVASIRWLNH